MAEFEKSKASDTIDEILEGLRDKGSEITYEVSLKEDMINLASQSENVECAMEEIANLIRESTQKFLYDKNSQGVNFVSGISTCIYLPDFQNLGEYKIKILGGDRSRDISVPVNCSTVFDVASITKLFTLILLLRLEEMGFIDLNARVSDVNPDFQNLEDFTLMDLIRLHGSLSTAERVDAANSQEEAYEILKTVYLKSNSRLENNYTDIGAIILSDTVEKIISQSNGKKVSFSEIMEKYLLNPLGLNNTKFNPVDENTSGTGVYLGNVHDPKARILGGAVGSAGLFTTSDDLAQLAKKLYQVNFVNRGILSREHLRLLGEVTFPDSKQNNKGNLGIYVKHPLGFAKTYTPSEFATGSFSHQGWTGAVATFDVVNGIHQNILVNSIYSNEDSTKVRSDKPVGYGAAFDEYLMQITARTMLMYLAKMYYSRESRAINGMDTTILVK